VIAVSATGFAPDTIRQQLNTYSVIAKPLDDLEAFLNTVTVCGPMLEAPANPRHSDGTSRIANQKAPVTTLG
jgi:hypothetical protein